MPPDFSDTQAKLVKPKKQSAFERSKAEAEAKRKRDEAEAAAVYKEFAKSFDHDDEADAFGGAFASQHPRHIPGGAVSGLHTGKRHFAASGMKKSGPGTLGPVPSAYGIKRSFNDFARGSRETPLSHHQEPMTSSLSLSEAFNNASDDEDDVFRSANERAELQASDKAQLRLTNLPPGTSPAAIKGLIPEDLVVDAVKIESPMGLGNERRCANAIVRLSWESSGVAIDTAISSLQNRYLGYGYYLCVQRHMSSAVLRSVDGPATPSVPRPFGAKQVVPKQAAYKQGGQHGFNRGFAPPSSYNPASSGANRKDRFYVPVAPPKDIRMLRLIHMTVERVLENGPEFEALLMSRPEVQSEEKWVWLWDSASVGGIWYRWRLWQLGTGFKTQAQKQPQVKIFEESAPWQVPASLPFEFVSELDEFTSHPDYDSSDDDDTDRDDNRANSSGEAEPAFLGPLDRAKLVHFLSRLPTSISKLRKGDVARITAFALHHADRGPSEVVDLVVSNIGRPLACTSANGAKSQDKKAGQANSTEEATVNEVTDTSGASLIGLYLVSDILSSSSSTTVIRHSWRLRALFEQALKDYQVFDFLGTMGERHGWGRLRAENWKRSIGFILKLWEGWGVFGNKSQELFAQTFENPPSLKTDNDGARKAVDKNKWKRVGANESCDAGHAEEMEESARTGTKQAPGKVVAKTAEERKDKVESEGRLGNDDVEGKSPWDDDVDGEPLMDDDVEGDPLMDDDVEGEPLMDDDVEGEPLGDDDLEDGPAAAGALADDQDQDDDGTVAVSQCKAESGRGQGSSGDGGQEPPRKRMRAVDMFADSEDSDR